jgi:hypothetical protein
MELEQALELEVTKVVDLLSRLKKREVKTKPVETGCWHLCREIISDCYWEKRIRFFPFRGDESAETYWRSRIAAKYWREIVYTLERKKFEVDEERVWKALTDVPQIAVSAFIRRQFDWIDSSQDDFDELCEYYAAVVTRQHKFEEICLVKRHFNDTLAAFNEWFKPFIEQKIKEDLFTP